MIDNFGDFTVNLTADLLSSQSVLHPDPESPHKILVPYPGGNWATLNLTPFACETRPADAKQYFAAVQTIDDLLVAYELAKQSKPFENDLATACDHVSPYAENFLQQILSVSQKTLSDEDARRIAHLASQLDVYTAVKSVESLLNSKADLALLKLAEENGWTLHFDHLAIRCGSSRNGDAERAIENLKQHHDYVASQLESENYFQFADGWDAYVLYKILENGQQLRLFVDQSSAGNNTQIIQHWNHVYGYTAHHLALRATRMVGGKRVAIPLADLSAAAKKYDVDVLTATGQYTEGLLEQVFTRPESSPDIPTEIRERLKQYDTSLEASIENGKLLELLSRREMNHAIKADYFDLYGITFDNDNPLHSAPVYPYFLPTQAAHVIRTSVEVA